MPQIPINDVLPLTQAIATGGQTVYSTNWTANAASDVIVYSRAAGVAANDATQQLATNLYTVAFIGGSQFVQVTLINPSTLGDIVTITRQTPADFLNLYSNTNFTPSMLNNDFDIMTLVDQQAQLVNQRVAPRYNYSEILSNPLDLILPLLGANETWVKNSGNTAFVPYTLPSSGIAPAAATYVTEADETATLANSFQLLGTANQIALTVGTNQLFIGIPNNPIIPGTAGMGIPKGTTAQRVIPGTNISFRYNTDLSALEFWDGSDWEQLGQQDLSGLPIVLETANAEIPDGYVLVAGSGVTLTPGSGTLTVSSTGGTVVSISQGAGITATPNPITGTGSIALAAIADHTLLANISGGSLAPSSTTLTALIDNAIGSTRGDILYRNATVWTVLAPGTAGFSLQSGGAGADPSYSNTYTNSTLVTPASLGVQQQALNMNSHLINNVTDPVSAQDAATKNYVDQNALNGTSVYAASAAGLGTVTQSGAGVGATLTNAGAQATFALDGVNPPVGSNVLIKNTATGMTAANEGIYTVTSVGSGSSNWVLTRATSYDTTTEINNTGLIIIQNGSTLSGSAWYNAATIVTVDTTNFSYSQFGSSFTLPLSLANGGTAANLTASNGGIVWSNASTFAILAGTATAGLPLLSGASGAPTWATGLGQIPGTKTNDSASSGNIGEFVTSVVESGAGSSMTSGTNVILNVTSISLTAGDWDVWGVIDISGTATAVTFVAAALSTTSVTLPTSISSRISAQISADLTLHDVSYNVPRLRFSLSTTTTIYLCASAIFSGGSAGAKGNGSILARRIR